MADRTALINSHDLWSCFDPKPDVVITRGNMIQPGQGGLSHKGNEEWFVIKNGKKAVGRHEWEGNLPDNSDARLVGFDTFEEAAAVSGHAGEWMLPQGKYMAGVWYPADCQIPDGLHVSVGGNGKSKPLKFSVGVPCSWKRYGSFGDGCDRVAAEDDVFCKSHRSSRDRVKANNAERKAESEARQLAAERKKQATQRASEILDEIGPALELLGHRPDLTRVDGGNLSMPAEMLKSLVDLAVEADEIRNL